MTAERIRHILKTEYGIESDEEFKAAVEDYRGINIGIFTMPLERSETSEQKAKAEAETTCKDSGGMRSGDLSLCRCAGV